MSDGMAAAQALEATSAAEDARIEKTRASLTAAVLELASEQSIVTVSVADLTRRAGINRSTFYAHANSPVELLSRVLSSELDLLRKRSIAELESGRMSLRDLNRIGLHDLIAHVVKYESIYGGGSGIGSATIALRIVLANHAEESVRIILERGLIASPVAGHEAKAIQAAFMAHGIAGAVEAWLRHPAPRDEAMLMQAVEATFPDWFLKSLAAADGPDKSAARLEETATD